ncbi:MAG: hypothetical protein HQK60_16605 [Deltaproteobacteria bacterium]|nr:hypothetical protein [Deltaproteobacteria bacterium]
MNLSIMNNVASLTAYTALSASNANLAKSIGRLSTGLRINSAADDPSGLAISERFQTQINGLNRASMNAQDGISMMQLAEGAMNETQSMLQRMRELALQAANGTLTASDRVQVQSEVDQLKQEIDRIAQSTEFNTRQLLNGDGSGIWSTDTPNNLTASLTGQVQEGNYRIIVQASATGTNDVWKSEVMQLSKPVSADQNSMRVGVSNTNGNMLSTATMTLDDTLLNKSESFSYKFLQGQAAEIEGQTGIQAALTAAGIDLNICATTSGFQANASTMEVMTNSVTVTGGASLTGTESVYFAQDSSFNVSTGGATLVANFKAGTYSLAEVQTALETATSGLFSITWAPNLNPAGGYFLQLSAVAAVPYTITVCGSTTEALGIGGGTLAVSSVLTGSQNSENANLFRITATNNVGNFDSAASTMSFDVFGNGHSATISFDAWKNIISSTGVFSGTSSISSIVFGENDVLNTINSALATNAIGYRAQIDSNHVLSFVATTADGTLAPTSLTINNMKSADSGTLSLTAIGITAGSFTGVGNNKIVFSVNQSTVYTASLASTTYSASTTGMNKLAADLETAMNNAIEAGSGTQDNLVDVAYDTTAQNFHVISRRVGLQTSATSEVQLFDGAGLASILSSIGLDLNTHALGNNDGISLAVYKGVGSDTPATNIYNRRGLNSAAISWGLGSGTTTISADATLASLGISLNFSSAAAAAGNAGSFSIDVTKVGDLSYIAKADNSLGEIAQFNGILDQPKNITIYANGHSATINFDKATTLNDLQNMIVSAVTSSVDNRGLGLQVDGQPSAQNTVYQHVADYITNTAEGTYVQATGDAAVNGTLLVRSPWAGTDGQITFAANDDVLKAFGFAEIQKPADTTGKDPYYIQVQNAHTGEVLGARRVSSPQAADLIPGVSFKFNPTVDVTTSWNDQTGKFDFTANTDPVSSTLHVVDRSLDLQIGPNVGPEQTVKLNIGSVTTAALGLSNVLMVDPNLASQSVNIIDNAINFISVQRAKLGAVQNRLEHTLNSLASGITNMTSANSSLTDLDMAKGVSEMTKNQILVQAGTAMMAQANHVPEQLLSLLK